jgi:hypothetical protein
VRRWGERILLGAVMSVVAFVSERMILRAVRKKGENNGVKPDRTGGLAATPQQVDDQAKR